MSRLLQKLGNAGKYIRTGLAGALTLGAVYLSPGNSYAGGGDVYRNHAGAIDILIDDPKWNSYKILNRTMMENAAADSEASEREEKANARQEELKKLLEQRASQEENNAQPQDEVFTCNYWKDLNQDNATSLDEIVGKGKKRFDINE